ncbi:hypothetical protein P7C70_g5028, partial [Phenoliferia sp. Uapishka_3]
MPVERWTDGDDEDLKEQLERGDGKVSWAELTRLAFPNGKFSKQECIDRWRLLSKPKPLRGPWTKEEDARLEALVAQFGSEKWVIIASEMSSRSGKQCRERWHNNLDPNINKGEWTAAEDEIIHQLYAKIGSRWAEMAKHLPGRPDNAIKNYWNASVVRQKRRRGGSISSLTGALDISAGDASPSLSRSQSSTSLSSLGAPRFAPYANNAPAVRSPAMSKSRSESGSSFSSLTGLSPLRRGASVDQFSPTFASPYFSPGMTRSQSYHTALADSSPGLARLRTSASASNVVARDLSKEMPSPWSNLSHMSSLGDTPPTTPDRSSPAYRRPHANSSPAPPSYPFAAHSSPPSPALSGHPHQPLDASHGWTESLQQHGAHMQLQHPDDRFGDELGYETLQPNEEHPRYSLQESQHPRPYVHGHSLSLDSYSPAIEDTKPFASSHEALNPLQFSYGVSSHQLHHVASQDSVHAGSPRSVVTSPYPDSHP